VNQVLDAAYSAFRAGLTSALTVSALMIFVAGLIAAVTIRPRSRGSGGGVEGGEPDQWARGSANRSRWRIASRARQP
jgi:hypothetical protein